MNRYPGRLHHRTPPWVETGATFHIRISLAQKAGPSLTAPEIAPPLLESARHYHEHARWHCRLMLLMPDHIHA
jgi:putative transposase